MAPTICSKSGNLIWVTKPNPREIENTMRTVKGIMREPKKGEATRKAPTRSDASIKNNKYIGKVCRSKPDIPSRPCIKNPS